ncbi:MAG TPA: DUF779 domain-containing protein [Candidatus Limnocylindrales bacterium]|nr:DUF779 domain-containing protein [Candidatus Limnocylindrales bacterium]
MTTIRISAAAAEVVARVRAERSGPLTFVIDGGCCEGAAPHLYEDAVITSAARQVGEVSGVPVYLQAAMIGPYADADVVIDVVDEPLSEAMSLETGLGVRFVLREAAAAEAEARAAGRLA